MTSPGKIFYCGVVGAGVELLPELPPEGWLPVPRLDPEPKPPKSDLEPVADPRLEALVDTGPPPN
ncbi:MAG TPA: hypothetical protein VFE22_01135, partial [Edaphobacter sp.]|nr:hypothetical protein [Edaphobacter sp.]